MGPEDMLRRQNIDRLRNNNGPSNKVPSQLANIDMNRLKNSIWTENGAEDQEQPAPENNEANQNQEQPNENNEEQQNDSF